mgnify:CR=1 FL=1
MRCTNTNTAIVNVILSSGIQQFPKARIERLKSQYALYCMQIRIILLMNHRDVVFKNIAIHHLFPDNTLSPSCIPFPPLYW